MANFCQRCGAALVPGAKFCTSCGAPLSSPESQPKTNILSQQPDAGQQSEPRNDINNIAGITEKQPDRDNTVPAAKQILPMAEKAMQPALSGLTEQIAFPQPGEVSIGEFGNISGAITQTGEILSPFKTVISSVKGFFGNLIGIFKNKKWGKLIFAVVLAAVWIVLMILSYNGTKIDALDWLTFAQGGLGRNIFGWFGGLFGKFTVAAAIFSLFNGGFKSLGSGFKALFDGRNFRLQNLGWMLMGMGVALAVYQFFAGNADPKDTMPALSGALISIMALGRNGFLSRFARSLTSKTSGHLRIAQNEKANGLLSGVTYGFMLGAGVSFIPFGWLPIIIGGGCIFIGLLLAIAFKSPKEVTRA